MQGHPNSNNTVSSFEGGNVDKQHTPLRLWLMIIKSHSLIDSVIRKKFRLHFGVTLSRFDLMAQLYRYPEGLKMSDLSHRLMVTGGNVTGLVHRLIADGLGARHENLDDRRVYDIRLNQKGMDLFAQMAVEHEKWIQEIFSNLSSDEIAHLSEMLTYLKKRLTHSERIT